MKIVSFAGFARVGKDTAGGHLIPHGYKRMAFADELKNDLQPLLERIGCDIHNPEHKDVARGMLVAYGRAARFFEPDYWVDRVIKNISEEWASAKVGKFVVTDVRYANEAMKIMEREGIIIRIHRPDYGPANDEEKRSFLEMEKMYPEMPAIMNDGTIEDLGAKLMKLLEELGVIL